MSFFSHSNKFKIPEAVSGDAVELITRDREPGKFVLFTPPNKASEANEVIEFLNNEFSDILIEKRVAVTSYGEIFSNHIMISMSQEEIKLWNDHFKNYVEKVEEPKEEEEEENNEEPEVTEQPEVVEEIPIEEEKPVEEEVEDKPKKKRGRKKSR